LPKMAAESEAVGTAQVSGAAGLNSPNAANKNSPSSNSQIANSAGGVRSFGHIRLDISNSVLPLDKITHTPSGKDGLSEEVEMQIRSLGCEVIQLSGKLLRLPQVAMATGCVLFQRFYYAKSLVRIPFDIVSMACICLACKIEEAPRRIRDIINTFNHIKQVRSGKPITPVILDAKYIALKDEIIKAERRVLKELGFCVHVKHPHKIIVMYLKWLELDSHRELLQMSWNFMNDSLRTDVFVRYPPETIAVACIYLSARKLKEPLPKSPSWFNVLGVEEDDIKDCCYRMICLYNRKKKTIEELEGVVEERKKERKKMDDERRAAREQNLSSGSLNTPAQSSPNSRAVSPGGKSQDDKTTSEAEKSHQNGGKNGGNGSDKSMDLDDRSPSRHKSKKHKKFKQRSRSRSTSFDDYRDRERGLGKKAKKGRTRSRSRSFTPPKKRKHGHHHHKDKRYNRSYSRDRGGGGQDGGRGGVASIGLHDERPLPKHREAGRDRDRDSNRDRNYDRKNRDRDHRR